MRLLQVLFATALLLALAPRAHAQDSTAMAKIYFVRSTGYTGVLLKYHCFVDSSLVCALKNNQYSVHEVAPGHHLLNVDAHSKENTNDRQALTIDVAAGQSYYIKIMQVKGYDNKVKMTAVSENTIRPVMAKCQLKTDCLQ